MATETYRQLTWKLRWHAADGSDRLSVRPRRDDRGPFIDVPPKPPTLVTFEDGDRVDANDLLRMGAIARWEVPVVAVPAAEGEREG